MKKKRLSFAGIQGLFVLCFGMFFFMKLDSFAADKEIVVEGNVYTLKDENQDFPIHDQKYQKTSSNNTYGEFRLRGNLWEYKSAEGISSFDARNTKDDKTTEEKTAEASLIYAYDDKLLNADDEQTWKLVSDNSKRIGDIDLEQKVGMGTIVVQSSFDDEHWMINDIQTDVFKDIPKGGDKILYTTIPNQLVNGCYYKVTVAYQTRKKSGETKLGSLKISTKYDYREHVEVYHFYVVNKSESEKAAEQNEGNGYNLNSIPMNVGMNSEYSEERDIDSHDKDNGCEIGQFYITGYSGNPRFYQEDEENKNNPIFLKNVGDKITLWFDLQQKDLNALNKDPNLKIYPDEKGADKYFHTKTQNFKRGALIIRFKDYQNKAWTNIYTDYLAAAATTTADTKVQLFEEGDYEVALDYIIEDSSPLAWKIPKPATYNAYRIFFKFSIRNSNCMVYPIDLKTNGELRTSYTENGFRLDLARSRYLDLSVKKKTLSSDGLDLRVYEIVDDLDEFADEGVYVFTVKNKITENKASKVIYVGTDNLLKAYARYGKDNDNGEYSIADLRKMQDEGYTFRDDGTIEAPEPKVQEEINSVEDAIITNQEGKDSLEENSTNAVNAPMPDNSDIEENSETKVDSEIVSSESNTESSKDRRSENIKKKDSEPSPDKSDSLSGNKNALQKEKSHITSTAFILFVIVAAGIVCAFYFKARKTNSNKKSNGRKK